MSNTNFDQPLTEIESLPANSSLWTFFKTDFFGKNYFNFKGRASRRELWTMQILEMIVKFILGVIFTLLVTTFTSNEDIIITSSNIFISLLSLYFYIPILALNVRRCHDINWRGWALLLGIPFILVAFWKGDRKDNRFGKNIYVKKSGC